MDRTDTPDAEETPLLFDKRKPVQDKLTKYGIIAILLIWGTVLLFRVIPSLPGRKFKLAHSKTTKNGLQKISFENVRKDLFKPKMQSLQWLNTPEAKENDKGLYVANIDDRYVIKSVFDRGYSESLLNSKNFTFQGVEYKVDSMAAAPDLSQLIIRTNTKQNWRHSTFGSYFVYNKTSEEFHHIGDDIALAKWSPNSVDMVYIQGNNMYLYSTESHTTVETITSDGDARVFNGKPDWVYEEEVLESDCALWWSPDGQYIAFFKIDESQVKEFTIPYYVQDKDDLYPEMKTIKYPKSGTPNPDVDLWIYSIKEKDSFPVNVNHLSRESSPVLITEVVWVGEENLIMKISDRSSDILKVVLVDTLNKESQLVRKNPSEGGWWEITHNTLYIPKNDTLDRFHNGYVDLFPVDGFNHLVYFSSFNSSKPIILTRGEWEVVGGPLAFDHELNRIYFIATRKSSIERHVYYVELHKPEEIHPVTDTLSRGVYGISFSAGARFALLSYRGPKVPYQKIIDFKSKENLDFGELDGNILGKTLYYLEKNEKLREILKEYDVPKKEFKELNLGKDDDGEDILVNAFEILPNDFNPKLKDYYPVFFYAYGGPNSQQVLQGFSIGFNEVVASQLNAIVVVVDGRGTGFKGKRFRSLVRDNLGEYEAIDQISAAKLAL